MSSELRARNVKPSKEVKDLKEKVESQVREVTCSGKRKLTSRSRRMSKRSSRVVMSGHWWLY
jgi:hypothetical protein